MLGTKGTGPRVYDEYRREPMDWYASENGEGMTTWFKPGDRYNAPLDGISVEEQDGVDDSLLTLYRELGALRTSTPALYAGEVGKVELSREGIDLYAMFRQDTEGNTYYTIINFMTEAVTANFTTITDENIAETLFASGFDVEGTSFTIEPAGYAVLRIEIE